MVKEELEIAFHDLLNSASSVRNIVYILLLEKKQPDKETKDYLKDCLDSCNKLVTELQEFRKKLIETQ